MSICRSQNLKKFIALVPRKYTAIGRRISGENIYGNSASDESVSVAPVDLTYRTIPVCLT